MAFNPNIPQPTDSLSQSQQDILANFQAIAPLFNQGIQDFVVLPVQGSAPTTAASEVALYSKSVSGTPQLFMRQQSNGTEFDFTSALKTTNGWARLPSGLLIKWGVATIASRNTLTTVTFPTGGSIPAFASILIVMGNPTFPAIPSQSQINVALSIGNFSVTNFQAFGRAIGTPGSTPAFDITYFAIGT